MSDLTKLTMMDAIDGLEKKEFSSVELTNAHLEAIENDKHNAFSVNTPEIALKMAEESDTRRQGGDIGLMEGIPIGVKDLFCVNGVSSTSCSNILSGFEPTYDSTVTTKLFQQGAVMLGKTNMDEFAMGSANSNSCYGQVINPWKRNNSDADLVPGGSSGGSAAAVAANLCFGSLGTDTGGSVRQPASFCGIVGVKPTYGRCSRWGMIAFASSLDQAGVFARSVKGAAIMLESICGHDPKDSTVANVPVPDFKAAIIGDIKGKKIGIPEQYNRDGLPDEIKELWEKGAELLKDAGAEIIEVELPHTKYALPAYYIIAPAEAASNLARYDGVRYGKRVAPKGSSLDDLYELTREEGFGDEVKRRIIIGNYVLSSGYYDAYYTKAQRVRRRVMQDFESVFEKVDAILTPATPTAAFEVGAKMDPLTMYLNDVFTVPASLAGMPGIVLPVGLSSDGLPLGLQLITNSFDEENLFKVAGVLEEAAGFDHKPGGEK